MDFALYVSVAIGYVGGVFAVLLLGRRIVTVLSRGGAPGTPQRRAVARGAAAGGFVGLMPALLLGVLGATFGGAYGPAVAWEHGIGASAVVIGSTLGMFAVVALVMLLSIVAGAWIGRLVVGANRNVEGESAR